MPFLKLEAFSGISPRTGPTLLQPNQAQVASNVKIQSGELRPWRKPVFEYTTGNSNVQTIYQLEKTSTGTTVWLEWTTDVNVVPGPVADVTDDRVYYTDGIGPKKTNWALATTSGTGVKPFPNAYYQMGVPNPTTGPTLVKSGGSGTVHEDRVYVYTYVNTFGAVLEESGPSPATAISTVEPNATVNYFYVGQVTVTPSTGIATGTFADNILAANLGVILPSLYYIPPPATLQGLVSMPNGILAGFTGNQVWFCEPYLPHAWPSSYMMTVGSPIVGLGVFGQTLVVCTKQHPYLITGSTPGSMTQEKLPLFEPCVAKRSIAGDQFGVLYASPNGIVSIAPGTMDVISRPLFTRDEWETYLPTSMIGVIYQNMYIAFYSSGTTKAALIITRGDTPPLVTFQTDAQAVFVQRSTANVYVVPSGGTEIYQLDADTVNNLFYQWTSKKFVLPQPTNFGAVKIQADWDYISSTTAYNAYVAAIVAANQALWASGAALNSTVNSIVVNGMLLGGSTLTPIPNAAENRNVNFILFSDGVQVYGQGAASQEPMRLPADSKGYIWEVQLTGNAPLRSFKMATSIGELKQI